MKRLAGETDILANSYQLMDADVNLERYLI